MSRPVTSDQKIAVFANVSQPPFANNLLPPVSALRRVAIVELVEPHRLPGFIPTGAAAPALVPNEPATGIARCFRPDVVVCLGGALTISETARRAFPPFTVFVGIALSDPLGISASVQIAPDFDLFYTQDPQTLPWYRSRGLTVRRCDHATDPNLFQPGGRDKRIDVIFVGKWSEYREDTLAGLASKCNLAIHAHRAEQQWRLRTLEELDTPAALSGALGAARLSIDFTRVEQPGNPFHLTHRITPRTLLAAACGVPSLIEAQTSLHGLFTPGIDIATFDGPQGLVDSVLDLLENDAQRHALGLAARTRVLQAHTWDLRIAKILRDTEEVRLASR
ncbi:MAG: glycosyltransferase [Acidobacteria bacterium]|nr:glycosyltransferase [Acidobacteriota bacterium]